MNAAFTSRLRKITFGTSAIAAVFLGYSGYFLSTLSEDADSPRRREFARHPQSGEQLSFRALAANERIAVTQIVVGCREPADVWTFIIDGSRPQEIVRLTRSVEFEDGYGARPGDVTASDLYELQDQDRSGLDAALECLRAVKSGEDGFRFETWEIDYFRDGKLIGEERLVANALINHEPAEYEQPAFMAARNPISAQTWASLVTFVDIAQRPAIDEGQEAD